MSRLHSNAVHLPLGPSSVPETQLVAAEGAATEKPRDDEFQLPPLSEQLQLDQLWDMLSECLTQLSRTPDHHAVLVLQPTVEAFFLVHAGTIELTRNRERKLQKPSENFPSTDILGEYTMMCILLTYVIKTF